MDTLEANLFVLADEFHAISDEMRRINATSAAAVHYLAGETCRRVAALPHAFELQNRDAEKMRA